jgi:phenylpropionate dioxygenase-like ring-hydroxylating dioxygenase large terminal subunit
VLYRTQAGKIAAVQQQCPHRFAPLDQGKRVGDDIQCPYHGLRFAPDGSCSPQPGQVVPPNTRLNTYPIEERYQLVWIWMGEAALADPDLIPDYSYLEEEGYGWFSGYLHVNGSYELMVDNLLDLSHAEFLHPLLASEGWATRNNAKIAQGSNWVTVENIVENDNILPIMAQIRPDMEPVGASVWEVRWDTPSLIRLAIQYSAAGERIILPSGHFLTPETKDTTHYVIRGGQDVRPNDPEFTAQMRQGVLHVFRVEDVPMIEAQQRYLGTTDLLDKGPAILKADAAAIRARRLLAKLIREEQNAKLPQMANA